MVTSEHIGKLINFWKEGQRLGTLLKIQGNIAEIRNIRTRKRNIKVNVADCEPYLGESKMTIFDELFAAAEKTGYKKQINEPDEQYMQGLLKIIQKLSDPDWQALSVTTKTWYNNAADQLRISKSLPPCPGFIGRGDVKKTIEAEVPVKGLTAVEALNTPNIKPYFPASRVQSAQPNTANKPKRVVSGIMDALRKTVIIHPDWSSRQVFDYLKLNGYPNAKLDTISVDGGNIRRVIEIMEELGWQKPVKKEAEPVKIEEAKV